MALQTGVANRNLIRQINKAVILRLIRELAPVSRTDLVDAASLSPATVSGITAELLRDALIVEQDSGRSTGGRRPIPLAINRDAGLAVGVKLTEDRIVLVVTDFQGTIVDRREAPLGQRDPEAVVATIAGIVRDVQAAHQDRRLFGIGLGLAERDRPGQRALPLLPVPRLAGRPAPGPARGRNQPAGRDRERRRDADDRRTMVRRRRR